MGGALKAGAGGKSNGRERLTGGGGGGGRPRTWLDGLAPRKLIHRVRNILRWCLYIPSLYFPWIYESWHSKIRGRFLLVDLARQTIQEVTEAPQAEGTVRFVCISDTHELHGHMDIPDGDVLLHSGDILLSNRGEIGSEAHISAFNRFLGTLPHKVKVVIAGNHDQILEDIGPAAAQGLFSNAIYLENSATTLTQFPGGTIKIYGSPHSPTGGSGNRTFQIDDETEEFEEAWAKIPEDTDILLTHSPRFGMLEKAIEKKKPRVHVSGHFHFQHGAEFLGATTWIKASSLYEGLPTHLPIVFDYSPS